MRWSRARALGYGRGMTKTSRGCRAAAVAVCLVLGCATTRESVRELPVGEPAAASGGPTIAVRAFADARGTIAMRTLGTSFVPVINLFYVGFAGLVPEQAATVESLRAGKPSIVTGSLERDVPFLLARALPGGRFAEGDAGADYEITGTIERSTIREHVNIVPMAVLSWLGAPLQFVDIDLRWTMEVRRCGAPALTRTYTHAAKKVGGAYYNRQPARTLLIAALRATIERARGDVTALVATQGPCAAAPAGDASAAAPAGGG